MAEFDEYNDNLVPCTGNDYDSSFESDRGGGSSSQSQRRKAAGGGGGGRTTAAALEVLSASSSSLSVPRTHRRTNADAPRLNDAARQFGVEQSREERRREKYAVLALDAYSRHKKLVNDYLLCYKGQTVKLQRDTSNDRTDSDVLRENHRFLWEEDDVESTADLSWGQRLAKKYYDKLFKEYCITDLRLYKENKIAFRWRTEQEVVLGKGQFSCGDKNCPASDADDLRSWEVNFAYVEHNERKNALVKVRLCSKCSEKLNYRKQRKEVTKKSKRKSAKRESDGEVQAKRDGRGGRKRHKKSSRRSASSAKKHKRKRCSQEGKATSSPSQSSSCSSSSDTDDDDEVSNLGEVKVLEEKRTEDENPWAKPVQNEDEPKLEDEFEAFLDDLFM